MAVRDFDRALAERRGGRPEFIVGGQKFTCRAKLSFHKFSQLMETMGAVDEDDAAGAQSKTEDFLRTVIVRQDRDRFMALLRDEGVDDDDDENVITPDQLAQIVEWLMDHYTGKGAGNENSSSGGPTSTGPSRNVVSLNPRTQTA